MELLGDGALELVSGPGVLAQQVRMVLGDGYIRESLPALQVPSTRQLIFEPILNTEMALDIIVSEVNDVENGVGWFGVPALSIHAHPRR